MTHNGLSKTLTRFSKKYNINNEKKLPERELIPNLLPAT